LIELLVVIAIIAILAAILFPVFARARAKAQQSNCLANVKQLALGELMYASDNDDRFPWAWYTGGLGLNWGGEIYPYVKNTQIFACPASNTTPSYNPTPTPGWGIAPIVYGDYMQNPCLGASGASAQPCFTGWVNAAPLKQASLNHPSEMIMVYGLRIASPFYAVNPDQAYALGNFKGGDPTLSASWNGNNMALVEASHNNGGNAGFADGHAKWLGTAVLYSSTATTLWNNLP
jgi:prepilin-type processing-associated H-X9-DG protein